jgi:hypothetical protein
LVGFGKTVIIIPFVSQVNPHRYTDGLCWAVRLHEVKVGRFSQLFSAARASGKMITFCVCVNGDSEGVRDEGVFWPHGSRGF